MLYLISQIIILLVLSLVAGFAMAWLIFGRNRAAASRPETRETKRALRDAEDELARRPDAETVKQLKADLAVRPTPGEAALLRAQIVDLERRVGLNRGAPTANHTAEIAPSRPAVPPPPPPLPQRAPEAPQPLVRQTWPDTAPRDAGSTDPESAAPNNVIDLRPAAAKLPPMPVTGSASVRLSHDVKDDAI